MTKDLVLHIQNTTLFIIANASFIACIYSYMTQKQYGFRCIEPTLILYSLVDLFVNKSIDIKIHHTFTLGIISYIYFFCVTDNDNNVFVYTLFSTEISSIFYVAKYYLPINSTIYYINNIIFFLLFFKLRIIDYSRNIIYWNSELYSILDKYSPDNKIGSSILLTSCYGLYLLNIYWFILISTILFKILTNNKTKVKKE